MFVLITVVYFLTALLRNYVMGTVTLVQTKKLHNKMLFALMRTPLSFFDSNPVGRILNRFSKDISIGDIILPVITVWFLEVGLRSLAVLIILCVIVPWSCFLVALVIVLGLLIRLKFQKIMTQAMKEDLISRSPVATLLGATLSGLATIRAFRKKDFFLKLFESSVDRNGRAFFTVQVIARSLAFYLDIVVNLLIAGWVLLCFLVRDQVDPLLLALTIQLVIGILNTFQFSVRLSSDLENYMNAISRCLDYSRLPLEATLIIEEPKSQAHAVKLKARKIKPVEDSFTNLKV